MESGILDAGAVLLAGDDPVPILAGAHRWVWKGEVTKVGLKRACTGLGGAVLTGAMGLRILQDFGGPKANEECKEVRPTWGETAGHALGAAAGMAAVYAALVNPRVPGPSR